MPGAFLCLWGGEGDDDVHDWTPAYIKMMMLLRHQGHAAHDGAHDDDCDDVDVADVCFFLLAGVGLLSLR